MCASKFRVASGFRDMAVFNEVPLGKQAWRLITRPNSLFERVMCKNIFLMGTFPTLLWVHIAAIRDGVFGELNHLSEKVFCGGWETVLKLTSGKIRGLVTSRKNHILTPRTNDVKLVSDLNNFEKTEWNYDLIRATFNERGCQMHHGNTS